MKCRLEVEGKSRHIILIPEDQEDRNLIASFYSSNNERSATVVTKYVGNRDFSSNIQALVVEL